MSFYGVFASWSAAEQALQGLGAKPIAYDPMLEYWLRMASGAFGLVGVWYFVLALWPRKFHAAIPWFGALMIAEGCVLFSAGLRLGLPPFPFCGDTAACFLGGGGTLLLAKTAKAGSRPISMTE